MSEVPVPGDGVASVHDALARRYAVLEQRRRVGFVISVLRRYSDIDGGTYAGVLSVTLFTTVLPLIILGFGYFSGFAENVSIGILFERQLGLQGALAQTVRNAFGSAEDLRTSWTVVGLAGFLVWGIPMAVTVAGIFARAWLRAPLSFGQRLWRGTVWFVLYLVSLAIRDQVPFGNDHPATVTLLLFCAALVPTWVFWTFTPALLVRDGATGTLFLAKAGLAGLLIDGVVLPLVQRLVFPLMLAGWTGFGPIGVAMTIIAWCGVIGIGWVVTACVSAVLWERSAPPGTVIAAQVDSDEARNNA